MLRVSVGSRRLVAAVSGKMEEPLMSACSRSSRRLTAFACSLQASRSAAVFSLLGFARYQPSEVWNQSSGVWNPRAAGEQQRHGQERHDQRQAFQHRGTEGRGATSAQLALRRPGLQPRSRRGALRPRLANRAPTPLIGGFKRPCTDRQKVSSAMNNGEARPRLERRGPADQAARAGRLRGHAPGRAAGGRGARLHHARTSCRA